MKNPGDNMYTRGEGKQGQQVQEGVRNDLKNEFYAGRKTGGEWKRTTDDKEL